MSGGARSSGNTGGRTTDGPAGPKGGFAGRGGGGAIGGQGGAGSPGSGAGSTGGQDRASRPSDSSPLGGIKGVLGGLLGYDTYGDLRTARANVARRQSGMTPAMVPNIPNASIGQILGGGLFSALAPGIGGAATLAGNIATGLNNPLGPYGPMAQGIDAAFGSQPGRIEGSVTSGRVNDQSGNGFNQGYQLPPGYMSQPQMPPQLPQAPQMPQMPLNRGIMPQKTLSPVPGYGSIVPSYGFYK